MPVLQLLPLPRPPLPPRVHLSPQSPLQDIRDREAGLRQPSNQNPPRHRYLRVLLRLRPRLRRPLLLVYHHQSPQQSQSQDTRVQPPDNRKPRRSPKAWETKLRDTPGRREVEALGVAARPAEGAPPQVDSFVVAGAGLPGGGEGEWGRLAGARSPGVIGRWGRHGEACMPGEGRRRRGTAQDGERGEAFARDTRRGHRQRRRVLGRIPLLDDRRRAAGRIRGPVVLPPTGGGEGGDGDEGEGGERSTRRPAALDQRPDPEANKCDTRTGLSFGPAACYPSSRWWPGRR